MAFLSSSWATWKSKVSTQLRNLGMQSEVDLPPVKFNLTEQVYFDQQPLITMSENSVTFYDVAKVLPLSSRMIIS